MIFNIHHPPWINELLNSEVKLQDIRTRLKQVVSQTPVVTVCVIAHNEEQNIVKCLNSLSRSVTSTPFDIIVVNNNSTDRTQEVLDDLGVTSYFQPLQGCGVSRELAQKKAKGKYVLLADADCLYPSGWVEIMSENLQKKGVVAVYGRHSFLGDEKTSRWKYALYELGKDLIVEIRNFKRPYLNTYGMSFGYIRHLGIKEGFITRNIRGEDGRLCFDLMKYGKIKLVRNGKSRVWTNARNLTKEGSLTNAVKRRILRETVRLNEYFKEPVPHNTKISENVDLSTKAYKRVLKERLRRKIGNKFYKTD